MKNYDKEKFENYEFYFCYNVDHPNGVFVNCLQWGGVNSELEDARTQITELEADLNLINEGFSAEKLLAFAKAKNDGRNELVQYCEELNLTYSEELENSNCLDKLVPIAAGGNDEITVRDTIDHLYYESWGFNRTLIDFLFNDKTLEEVESDILEMVGYHKLVIIDAYLNLNETALP